MMQSMTPVTSKIGGVRVGFVARDACGQRWPVLPPPRRGRQVRANGVPSGCWTLDEKALTDAVAALAARLPLAEPPEAALAAEECRLAWRPGRLRVLLLAESHIATGAADLAWRVALPPGLDWPGPAPFVRHIYCAGYGEPELLEAPPGAAAEARPRGGTPQFWRLMAAAEGADCPAWPAVARGGTEAAARLSAKAALLHRSARAASG